jgi:glycosyltransferase involved in cell wall biosynthesis
MYPEAPFVAISKEQAHMFQGLNVVGTVLHAVDTRALAFRRDPDDYLLFLGRFTEGKGVLQAIDVARRTGIRLVLAAADNDYYREHVAAHVDGSHVVYAGEADYAAKVKLYGGAKALLYPVQSSEPFGLVLAEAMACGTPVAALDRGAVREVIDDGETGIVFGTLEQMIEGLSRVFALDRRLVRERAVARFGVERMVAQYETVYQRLAEGRHGRA